ncbi:hypothetical protein PHMEG_00011782 [Phytophthora megakarya]|uniref:Peptidase A2 domain-containing protein n=1 Tax=Phytophthora megakarya TaxID=4795 RepID=A0A225WBD6_9STRA|nr:hypothetical protein PHMEG_00011782 [Phytophthora megakarya]
MTLVQDKIIYPEQLYPEYQRFNKPDSGSSSTVDPVEVALDMDGGKIMIQKTIMRLRLCVGQSMIGERVLDTGASVSIVSLDLARRLSLKIRTHQQIKVSGLREIPTYISAHTRVKTTLVWEVVYIQDVWIGNIVEGVDVLLGMNFMYSAGVRLSIREGLVKLPDEENVVIGEGWNCCVCAKESLYLRPGEATVVKIEYGQTNPQREVVWVGRGKRWVTAILFGVRPGLQQSENVWNDTRTALAWIVEYGHFPKESGFVRPGKTRYKEWQRLILESTESHQGRMRDECLEQLMRLRDPPAVPRPEYQWPTKLHVLPKSQDAEVRLVQLQERPEVVEVFLAARRATTPKPGANAVGVKDLTGVPVTTSAEKTGEVGTRDVGT